MHLRSHRPRRHHPNRRRRAVAVVRAVAAAACCWWLWQGSWMVVVLVGVGTVEVVRLVGVLVMVVGAASNAGMVVVADFPSRARLVHWGASESTDSAWPWTWMPNLVPSASWR